MNTALLLGHVARAVFIFFFSFIYSESCIQEDRRTLEHLLSMTIKVPLCDASYLRTLLFTNLVGSITLFNYIPLSLSKFY